VALLAELGEHPSITAAQMGHRKWAQRARRPETAPVAGITPTAPKLPYLQAVPREDVDIDARRLAVQRAVSAGIEGPTKSWQARFIPLADPAAEAFQRLLARGHYTQRDDYVFCSRLGRRLDGAQRRHPVDHRERPSNPRLPAGRDDSLSPRDHVHRPLRAARQLCQSPAPSPAPSAGSGPPHR
jgi:hypothetical protein